MILKNNTKNRNLSKTTIITYVDQMVRGQWKLTSQTITFDKDGLLIDGQHRLAAVVKSKLSQTFLIARGGNHDDIFKTYDTGKKRSAGDVLSIENIKNANGISGTIKKQIKLTKLYSNIDSGIRMMTNKDVLDVYSEHPEQYQEIYKFSVKCIKKLKLYSPTKLSGIISYLTLTKKHDQNYVFEFFEALHFNTPHESSVISLLRDKLINSMLSQSNLSEVIQVGLIKKAWNYYVSGKDVKLIKITFDEAKQIQFI